MTRLMTGRAVFAFSHAPIAANVPSSAVHARYSSRPPAVHARDGAIGPLAQVPAGTVSQTTLLLHDALSKVASSVVQRLVDAVYAVGISRLYAFAT